MNGLGKVLRFRGNLDEARACHERALVTSPRDPTAHHHLGQLLLEHGRLAEASQHYFAGRAKSPRDSLFHLDIGELLAATSRPAEARPHFERALGCDPTNAEAHHGLGRVLMEEGRLDAAEAAFREAIRLDPALARSWSAIARIEAERGDLELSCESARKALAIRPEMVEAYLRLAVNQRGRLADSEEQSLERLIHEPHLPADAKSHLYFSLAIVRDRRGLYAEAASLFDKAHEIQAAWRAARGQFYDAARQSQFNERMIAAFPPGSFDQNRLRSDLAVRPVFIVGLPRSGTSLIEQILASHRSVWGAGELPDLHNILRGLPELAGSPETPPVELLRNLDPGIAQTMARQYTDRLAAIAPEGAARVVDKMQDNIRLLGLIGLILPGARVILCTRDLRDVAVSCRQASFTANIWTDDWQTIARRFADYQRIVAHWQRVRPVDWLEVNYEKCVQDLEPHARRMIEFLELEWDPACLDFASTRRVVRTASLSQVREPVHDRSIGRWRRYETWHAPMLDAFKAHGVNVEGPD